MNWSSLDKLNKNFTRYPFTFILALVPAVFAGQSKLMSYNAYTEHMHIASTIGEL